MTSIQTKLRLLKWNKERFTPRLVDECIIQEGIEVIELPLPAAVSGFYGLHCDQPAIAVNARLFGGERHEVITHELFHCWLNVPGCYSRGTLDKIENYVERLSACALIPKPIMRSRSRWDIQEEYGYSDYLMNLRQIVWDIFKD